VVVDPKQLGGRRPNQVAIRKRARRILDQWFIRRYSSPDAPGLREITRGAVRDQGRSVDVSLFRTPNIGERMKLQFRAEASTLPPHDFDGVRTTRQSGSFGRIISTRDPRIMQLALKFYF